jgi:transcriptional regulator with XRE-family HTH domain
VNVEGSIPVEETEFWKQMNRDRIGNLLAGARLKAGLTQGQLARKLGIRQNMVSDYERGRRSLSAGMAARFSTVLHIKESHLQCRREQQAGH